MPDDAEERWLGEGGRGPREPTPPMFRIDFTWLVHAVFAMLMRQLRLGLTPVPCAPCERARLARERDRALGKEPKE